MHDDCIYRDEVVCNNDLRGTRFGSSILVSYYIKDSGKEPNLHLLLNR